MQRRVNNFRPYILATMLLTPGMILAPNPRPLRCLLQHISRHMAILGGTGKGKSKLCELLCRQIILQSALCGLTVIDPHGDTVEALLLFLAANNIDPSQVIYLKVATGCCFSFDPFGDVPEGLSDIELRAWLMARVDRCVDALLRNSPAAAQDIMKRLRLRLRCILFACGVPVDGRHLGLADALILADPRRPEFTAILDHIGPTLQRLAPDIHGEFVKVRHTRSEVLRDKWTESATNALSDLLSGAMARLIFAQDAPSINWREVVLGRKIVLINLRKNRYLSRKEANAVGGLLFNFLVDAAEDLAEELPFEHRVPHVCLIDEAERFLGEDLRMGFAELRKTRLALGIFFQDLGCLRRGDLDLAERVISNVGCLLTFAQQDPESIEYLAKAFLYGSLDLTPLIVDTVLPGDYKRMLTRGMSLSANRSRARSRSQSVTKTHSETRQVHTAESIQEMFGRALSSSHTRGNSTGLSFARGKTAARGRHWARGLSEGESEGEQDSTGHTDGRAVSDSTSFNQTLGRISGAHGRGLVTGMAITHSEQLSGSDSSSHGTSRGRSTSRTAVEGESLSLADAMSMAASLSVSEAETEGSSVHYAQSRGRVHGTSHGESDGISVGTTTGTTDGDTRGVTVQVGEQIVMEQRVVQRPSGHTIVSVPDQLWKIMNDMASLPDRMVLVKCNGMRSPFMLEVHEVRDPYAERGMIRSKAWIEHDIQRYLQRVVCAHPFYFVPTHDNQQERVSRFLGDPAAASIADRHGTNGHSNGKAHKNGEPTKGAHPRKTPLA